MNRGRDAQPRDAFAVERRDKVRRLVSERGRVRTSELSQLFQVTEPTIRKDIADLATQGLLVRTHGGAVARRSTGEIGLAERKHLYTNEKRSIAEACVDLISDRDSVFLDGGTTTSEIARVLTERIRSAKPGQLRDIKILTTSFQVAEICAALGTDSALVAGGRYRAASGTTVGPLALSTLAQFRLDIAFLGVTGITEEGFSVADLAEAQLKREVIKTATRNVVPMDHRKVGLSDFVTVCPIDDIHTVVTDRPDPGLTEWLTETSVELLISNKEAGDD